MQPVNVEAIAWTEIAWIGKFSGRIFGWFTGSPDGSFLYYFSDLQANAGIVRLHYDHILQKRKISCSCRESSRVESIPVFQPVAYSLY
jgi:hypothetical protein